MLDRSSFETEVQCTEYHRERNAIMQRIRNNRRAKEEWWIKPESFRFQAKEDWYIEHIIFKEEVAWDDEKRRELGYPQVRRYFICRNCNLGSRCFEVPKCGCGCAGACDCIGSRPCKGPRPHFLYGGEEPYEWCFKGGVHDGLHLSAHSRTHTLAKVVKGSPQSAWFIKGKGCLCLACV